MRIVFAVLITVNIVVWSLNSLPNDHVLRDIYAYNEEISFQEEQVCSIRAGEFTALIQSARHVGDDFLYAKDSTVPQMWWGALLGLNDSLEEPFERTELEELIRSLRTRGSTIDALNIFLRTEWVYGERNAEDFFRFIGELCETGKITRGAQHIESALIRAHASLGDAYTSYVRPPEATIYTSEPMITEDARPLGPTEFTSVHRLNENLYLLKLTSLLSQEVAEEVRERLESIAHECPVPHLILDLRNNRGGFTYESVGVAANLLGNQTIVQWENREGRRQSIASNTGEAPFRFRSITVLVNHETASAAEIITAALAENGATIVGEQTYGKGVAQTVAYLSNGGASRVTHFNLYSPSGYEWQGQGIIPNMRADELPAWLASVEMVAEMRANLGPLYFDPNIVTTYRLVREGRLGYAPCEG